MTSGEQFMRRAIELAEFGTGHVSPNPKVGCIIVHKGRIVSEGWHKKYGEAHAEVNAINALGDHSILPECEVYVNLEPCSHHGKTPPCADLLIERKVGRVIIANGDPNPLVAGTGVKKLEEAGIPVSLGVLENEGAELNRRFFTFMKKQRPYIVLKWAQTSDGFIARSDYSSKWISNTYSRQLVHKWRTEEDAVLVGGGTASYDNPRLNVRDWTGRNPVRVVIDSRGSLDKSLAVFDNKQNTLCYNMQRSAVEGSTEYVKLETLEIDQIVESLYQKKIQSVIVEGGTKTISAFVKARLWDEMRVFTSPQKFGSGISAPGIDGKLISSRSIMDDTLEIYSSTH